MERIYSFEPILGNSPRVLILGSFPSVKSLEAGQYYGNPQNHFWGLLSAATNTPFPADYAERKELLKSLGIAVWDSAASCVRKGSLDKDIQSAQPNDVNTLLTNYTTIRAVFFNGTTAQKLCLKRNPPLPELEYILLPSSSPVPRRTIKTLADKLPYWLRLAQYL